MRTLGAVVVLGALAAHPGAAQTTHRELGPHEHGRGTLNIAVEGNKISMELDVPGIDIVGFEHEAKTHKDKTTLEKAKQKLSAPLSLFKLPASAGCRVTEAKVEVETGEHDHAAKEEKKGEASKSSEKEQHHSEFHNAYSLECSSPASITGIEFGYFNAFPGAEKLEVNVITPKGQNKFEVTRTRPNLSLAGMI
jgi:Protein of unknown function (DUF2796)